MKTITFQIYLNKPQVADDKSLMFVQQQCLCHRKLLVIGALINGNMLLKILETLVKKLDEIAA